MLDVVLEILKYFFVFIKDSFINKKMCAMFNTAEKEQFDVSTLIFYRVFTMATACTAYISLFTNVLNTWEMGLYRRLKHIICYLKGRFTVL